MNGNRRIPFLPVTNPPPSLANITKISYILQMKIIKDRLCDQCPLEQKNSQKTYKCLVRMGGTPIDERWFCSACCDDLSRQQFASEIEIEN